MLIYRKLEQNIKNWIFKGKIIIIYGPRQVGKTTLVQNILKQYPNDSAYYLCDLIENQELFSYKNASRLADLLSELKLIVVDEAQRIENIGLVLKIIHDLNPNLQIIVTGSSSFELANKINEPLTGRTISFKMFGLAITEIFKKSELPNFRKELPNMLRFGQYPDIYTSTQDQKIKKLNELAGNNLFKDIYALENIKNPLMLQNLLKLLALQLGNEVSFSELATQLNVDISTIERYIGLLEQAFIIFRLPAFSRNLRKEVSKTRKIYFYDLGIRNSIIPNYNLIEGRDDLGPLWENFCILERRKLLEYRQTPANSYFWRTYDQQEIDYIEEKDGLLTAYEFKWNSKKSAKIPKVFASNYHHSAFEIVNPNNFWEWIF